jgi:molecular chaperone GrpE
MKKQTDIDNEVIELKQKNDELNNKYLRALADYQNLSKRTQEQINDIRKYAAEVYIVRLLPILDTLLKTHEQLDDIGLGLALKEFTTLLAEMGVEKIITVGKEFNPEEMECIEVVTGEDNVVMVEALAGYKLNNKVIRVAQVKVGKKSIN